MATFDVKVVKIERIEEHGNADALELAVIHGFRSVVKKGQYRRGDLAVYIPEAALIPKYLLKRLGMWDDEKVKGRLNGSEGNRVKAIKLRGVVSQGILLELESNPSGNTRYAVTNGEGIPLSVLEGVGVGDALGIRKWEPEIPPAMAGEVTNIGQVFPGYDVENFQRFPDVFEEGEYVVATEKLHGCLHRDSLVMLPNGEELPIEQVVADESITHVLSFHEERGEFITRQITARMRRPNTEGKKWVRLNMENGRSLVLTHDHPVFSRSRGWIDAGEIQSGEDVESPVL